MRKLPFTLGAVIAVFSAVAYAVPFTVNIVEDAKDRITVTTDAPVHTNPLPQNTPEPKVQFFVEAPAALMQTDTFIYQLTEPNPLPGSTDTDPFQTLSDALLVDEVSGQRRIDFTFFSDPFAGTLSGTITETLTEAIGLNSLSPIQGGTGMDLIRLNVTSDPCPAPTPGKAPLQICSAPIPEPSSFLLLGTSFVALLCYGWRRKKQAA